MRLAKGWNVDEEQTCEHIIVNALTPAKDAASFERPMHRLWRPSNCATFEPC